MKIRTKIILSAVTFAALVSGPFLVQKAMAAGVTPNSACGAMATGKLGKLDRECADYAQTGTCFGKEHTQAQRRHYVNGEGWWSTCPAGVKEGQFPHLELRPKDCPKVVFKDQPKKGVWESSEGVWQCHPDPMYGALPAANAGSFPRKIYDGTKEVAGHRDGTGYQVWQCVGEPFNAKWTVIKQTCKRR